jgi:hypothetical protein
MHAYIVPKAVERLLGHSGDMSLIANIHAVVLGFKVQSVQCPNRCLADNEELGHIMCLSTHNCSRSQASAMAWLSNCDKPAGYSISLFVLGQLTAILETTIGRVVVRNLYGDLIA